MAVPAFSNVFLVALSGVSQTELSVSSSAPNISGYVAKYASSSSFSALAYPSLPNILALSGGSTEGVTSNSPYQQFSAANIFSDRIGAQGLTWKVYAEDLPADPTTTAGGYSYFYNPQIFYSDAYAGTGSDSHIVDFTQLSTDLTAAAAPSFSWILPNSSHNMSGGVSSIAAGDTFVGSTVSSIQAHYPNALIVLWWDSDDGTGGNVVPLVFLSSQLVEVGYSSSTAYNHYNLLATIEEALGLNPLGANDMVSMDEFFAQGPAGGEFTAPVWVDSAVPSTLYQGMELFFQFDAQGNPFPSYSVTSGALPGGLTLDPDYGALTGAPATIGSFSFTVTATNGLGSADTVVTTEVIPTPVAVPPAVNPDIAPDLDSFTDASVAEGSQYYFTVSVTTGTGTGVLSSPSVAAPVIQAPDAPTDPVATAGNGSAVVTWVAPTDTGGAPLSGYIITVQDRTLGTTSKVTVPVVTSVNIPDLVNGHYYSFIVQAASVDNKLIGRGVPTSAVLCSGSSNIISLAFPNPPVNTPQPNYPTSVVSYTPVTDYPNSYPSDVGYAYNINALHSEIWAIEQTLGTLPLADLPYLTLQEALFDLAVNKALVGHSHSHNSTSHDDADDHYQYAKLDGSRAFAGPVSAPDATQPEELVTLAQVQAYGFNLSSLSFGKNPVVGQAAAEVVFSVGAQGSLGTKYPWMAVGGHWYGETAPDGLIQIAFEPAWESHSRFSHFVISFDWVVTTYQPNTTSAPYFSPQTDSLTTYWVDTSHAMLYVETTASGLPQRFLGISWMAIGL